MEQRKPQELALKQEPKVAEKENNNTNNQQRGPPNQQGGGGGSGDGHGRGGADGHGRGGVDGHGRGGPDGHGRGGADGRDGHHHPYQRRNPRFRGPREDGPPQGGHPANQFHNQQGGQMDGDRKERKFRPRPLKFGGGLNNQEDRFLDRLQAIEGPTFDLAPLDTNEKKFAGRNRLYIGNLPAETTEADMNDLFKPFGETSETFINKEKYFGFIRLDYHTNAEKAKRELDGTMYKTRTLKVRFAPNGAAIKVKNLTHWVTDELLYTAFSIFGEIERCVIIVDDRGKTTGEGIIEFARKPCAQAALKHCTDGCFFLTSSLRPVIAESYDQMDVIDGYPEKSLMKKTADYHQAREVGPRFASPGSFEHEYGTRWKQLHELYKQKEMSLKQELSMEEGKLEAQMQYAKFENETEMLREQLRAREADCERQKREWKERERIVEEQQEQMRLQKEELEMRMHNQDEDISRRRQENSLFMQAHQLSNMLDQQEQDNVPDYVQGGIDGEPPIDPKSFMKSYERGHRFEGRGMGDGQGISPRGSGRGHWGNDNRRDDYQNKMRRY